MAQICTVKIIVVGLILSNCFDRALSCSQSNLLGNRPARSTSELIERAKRGLVLLVPHNKDGSPLDSSENPLEMSGKKKETKLIRSKRDPTEHPKIFLRHNEILKDNNLNNTESPIKDGDNKNETEYIIRVEPKDLIKAPIDVEKAPVIKRQFEYDLNTDNEMVHVQRIRKNGKKFTCYCKDPNCRKKQCFPTEPLGLSPLDQNSMVFPNFKEYNKDDSEEDTSAEDTDDEDFAKKENRITPAPRKYNLPLGKKQRGANYPRQVPNNYPGDPANFDPAKVPHLGIFTPNIVIPGQYLPVVPGLKDHSNYNDCIKLYGHTICAIASTTQPSIDNVDTINLSNDPAQKLNPAPYNQYAPYQYVHPNNYQYQQNPCPEPNPNNPGQQSAANVNVIIGNPKTDGYSNDITREPDIVNPIYDTTYKDAGLSDIATAASNAYASVIPTIVYPKPESLVYESTPPQSNPYEPKPSSDYPAQYTTPKPSEYTPAPTPAPAPNAYPPVYAEPPNSNNDIKVVYPPPQNQVVDEYDKNKSSDKSPTTRAADYYPSTPDMYVPLSSTNKNYNEVVLTSNDIYSTTPGVYESTTPKVPVAYEMSSTQNIIREYTAPPEYLQPVYKASSLPSDPNYLNPALPESTNDAALVQNVVKKVINNFVPGKSQDLIANFGNVNNPEISSENLLPEVQRSPDLKSLLKIPEVRNMIVDTTSEIISEIKERPVTGDTRKLIEDTLDDIVNREIPYSYSPPAVTTDASPYKNNQWVTERANAVENMPGAPPPEVFEKIKGIIAQSRLDEEHVADPIIQNLIVKAVKHALDKERGVIDESTIRRAFRSLVHSKARDYSGKSKRSHYRSPIPLENLYQNDLMERGPLNYFFPNLYDTVKDYIKNNPSRDPIYVNSEERMDDRMENPNDQRNLRYSTSGVVIPSSSAATGITRSYSQPTTDYPVTGNYIQRSDRVRNLATGSNYNQLASDYPITRDYVQPASSIGESLGVPSNIIVERKRNDQVYLLVEYPNTGSASQDAPIGRLVPANKTDLPNLKNSKLAFVSKGIRFPLAVRKLSDGSSVIMLSDDMCQQFSNKKCPCCIPYGLTGTIRYNDKLDGNIDYLDEETEDKVVVANVPPLRVRRESAEELGVSRKRSYKTPKIKEKTVVVRERPAPGLIHFLFGRPPYRRQREVGDYQPNRENPRATVIKDFLHWLRNAVADFPRYR